MLKTERVSTGIQGLDELIEGRFPLNRSFLATGEMILQNGRLARRLVIEKMRCTDVKPAQHEFDIVKGHGIVLQGAR
jgi:KaiC/GvpD/RAD55 family RecA-like ATPase